MSARAISADHRTVRRRSSLLRYHGGWTLLHVFTIAASVGLMIPFVWAIMSSLKEAHEVRLLPPTFWPRAFQWQNYPEVLTTRLFSTWATNTFYIALVATLGTVLSAALAGYAFARFRFPGRTLLFSVTISTMLLPAAVTLIPSFLLFYYLGWLNTHLPLIIPYWFGGGAFFIFLFRQFFMTIPLELDEAAKIDGANPIQVLFQIVLPLSLPVLATVGIIAFINHYNAFIFPLIVLNDPPKFTMPIGLRYFNISPTSDAIPRDHHLLAMSVMMTAPIILLFFVGQRYFVQGVVMSGIKG